MNTHKEVSAVYQIVCTENNRRYIGSSKNIKKRFSSHLSELKNKKHYITDLQDDWDKFGEDGFKFYNLRECSADNLREFEEGLLKQYEKEGRWEQLYNSLSKVTSLSDKQVVKIREQFNTGQYTQTALADRNDISCQQVSNIIYGEVWADLGGPIAQKKREEGLTHDQVVEIRELYATGEYTQQEIGDKFTVTVSHISYICSGTIYEDLPGPTVHNKKVKPLKNEDVVKIREQFATGSYTRDELANKWGETTSRISRVVNGNSYSNVGGPIADKVNPRGLTGEQVKFIREEYAAGKMTQIELSERFGIALTSISRACTGKTYKSAPGPITKRKKKSSLSDEDVLYIRESFWSGDKTRAEIGKEFDMGYGNIYNVTTGKSYKSSPGPIKPE